MKEITINNKKISFEKPLVMGILNLTPDSFFDGGKYLSEVAVRNRIKQIKDEGADIIDIGAYSSRPGADHISEDEELKRLIPTMEIIKRYHAKSIISIDTFRASVVEEITRCYGSIIVNDISGGNMDSNMFNIVAKYKLPYIMMHMQGTPQTMQKNPEYGNITEDVLNFFKEKIKCLEELGHHQIIIDPGFGFGKTLEQNYKLLREMDKFEVLGKPVLVGVSRKSMIYKLLDCSPENALSGTIAVNTLALNKGASILRVHDVVEGREVVDIFNMYKNALKD